jgi:hypothetical protein
MKFNWKIILIIVLLVVVAGGLFLYFSKPTNETVPSSSQPPQGETDQTADWQTYTNTQYGFEFKYPTHATTTPDTNSVYISFPDQNVDFAAATTPSGSSRAFTANISTSLNVMVESSTSTDMFFSPDMIQSSSTVQVDDLTFNKTVGTGVGAGSIYNSIVYSTVQGDKSYWFNFILRHATDLGLYVYPVPEGYQAEFDARIAEAEQTFSQTASLIVSTFKFFN